jgi:hypothetical protein
MLLSSSRSRVGLLLAVVLLSVASCTSLRLPTGKSPLRRAQMSPDSCVLDVFFVRVPLGDEEANGSLWDEIDEQGFPTDLRRRLVRNGFRVGLVGGQMPLELARMLELGDTAASARGLCRQVSLEELETVPTVVPRHLQLRAGRRSEIVTSGLYDEMHLLLPGAGGLCGRSYPKAQGVFALEAYPEPDGRVRLELAPEVHYGSETPRIVGSQGAFRMDTSRPRRAFSDMAVSATLTAGEMLVLTCLPDRPGSLGHRFFTHECGGQAEQKLLVIRLSQTQHDGLFSPRGAAAAGD